MNDMSTRMWAPWYHYVGAVLIGWAMAALMYTYQLSGSPLIEGTFQFTNLSIVVPSPVKCCHSMDFLPPFQPSLHHFIEKEPRLPSHIITTLSSLLSNRLPNTTEAPLNKNRKVSASRNVSGFVFMGRFPLTMISSLIIYFFEKGNSIFLFF